MCSEIIQWIGLLRLQQVLAYCLGWHLCAVQQYFVVAVLAVVTVLCYAMLLTLCSSVPKSETNLTPNWVKLWPNWG